MLLEIGWRYSLDYIEIYRLNRFIVEGNSASGSVRNGRDADISAVFLLRGVVQNAIKSTLAETMSNNEWKNLVTVLRCGIGDKFNIDKLYFDRINILTDSDIDG